MKTVLCHTTSDFSVEDEVRARETTALRQKAKSRRTFATLSKEEFAARVNVSTDALEAALEQGRKDMLAAERAYVPPKMCRVRFT